MMGGRLLGLISLLPEPTRREHLRRIGEVRRTLDDARAVDDELKTRLPNLKPGVRNVLALAAVTFGAERTKG